MRLLALCLLLPVLPSNCQVKLLLAVWRHGDRAPERPPYVGSPYDESYWPRGWNQLTNLGIEQAVLLGSFLRNRYKDFLPDFNRQKVYVRSSDADRAIETAQSVMTAMFPPEGEKVWTTGELRFWQPIPIRTLSKPDPMLRPSKVACPAYDKIVQADRKIREAHVNQKYKVPLSVISRRTGGFTHYANINDMYNIVLENYNGLPLPSWASELVDNTTLVDTIKELRRVSRLQLFDTKEKAKYKAGYLINDWANHLTAVAHGSSKKRALLYSSHDGTLSSLLYSLEVSNDLLIPYTACVMLELHDDNSVQLFYRNTTTTDPSQVQRLLIPGCSASCPLSQFLEFIENIRIRNTEDLKQVCSLETSSVISLTTFQTLIIVAYYFL